MKSWLRPVWIWNWNISMLTWSSLNHNTRTLPKLCKMGLKKSLLARSTHTEIKHIQNIPIIERYGRVFSGSRSYTLNISIQEGYKAHLMKVNRFIAYLIRSLRTKIYFSFVLLRLKCSKRSRASFEDCINPRPFWRSMMWMLERAGKGWCSRSYSSSIRKPFFMWWWTSWAADRSTACIYLVIPRIQCIAIMRNLC